MPPLPTCPACTTGALDLEVPAGNRLIGRARCGACRWRGHWMSFAHLIPWLIVRERPQRPHPRRAA